MSTIIDAPQRTAARVVGLCYLLALPPALFAELYVFGRLILLNNVAGTAQNIIEHERLFRLGIASNLFVFALDAVLMTALYVVLRPVNRAVAFLATFWRLVETTILVVTTLSDFSALRVLGNAQQLRGFTPDQLYALASLALGGHGAAYNVALFFAGLGTTLFCYLWLAGRLLPRPLAAWGMFAGLVLASCAFGFIVLPELKRIITLVYYGGPIFIFELTAGLWLLFRGLPRPDDSISPEHRAQQAHAPDGRRR